VAKSANRVIANHLAQIAKNEQVFSRATLDKIRVIRVQSARPGSGKFLFAFIRGINLAKSRGRPNVDHKFATFAGKGRGRGGAGKRNIVFAGTGLKKENGALAR